MDNENKNLQDEMQEKVRQDVSEKIAEAAAELQEEIAEATAQAEEVVEGAAEEILEEIADEFAGEEFEVAEEMELPKPEPKKITLKVRDWILSLVGTAIAGALVLLLCLQIPGWIAAIPEGKTVMSVDGVEVTDMDMNYYIYAAAMDYFRENKGDATDPAEYDWQQDVGDGKTAGDIVKEKAIETATEEALLMGATKKYDVEWDEEEAKNTATMQIDQMTKVYGEELVELNARAQGLLTTKQYQRKIVQSQHISAVETDMEENPDQYYPKDLSVLSGLEATDKASVKHILIKTKTEESEEGLSDEEALAKATDIANRAKSGEDFDALVAEFNEDPGATKKGYTFGPGEMVEAFETTSFAMKIGEISDPVKTEYGYHVIKRIPGKFELLNYWKNQAKINIKGRKIAKMSVADIMKQVAEDTAEFQTMYAQVQGQ